MAWVGKETSLDAKDWGWKYCSTRSPALIIENGGFRVNHGRSYKRNSVVIAYCKKGQRLQGDKIMICDGSNWKVRQRKLPPSCQEPKCPEPPRIENGFHYYKNGTFPRKGGSRVFYKCLDGFRIDKRVSYLICLRRSKIWRGKIPRCTAKIKCKHPGNVAYGLVTLDNLMEQSEATFECEPGNKLIGAKILKCQSSGKWDKPIPHCRPNISCPVPPQTDIPNSAIEVNNPSAKYILPGEFMDIKCAQGYRLDGISFLECLEDETWDSDLPKCEAVSGCKLPSIPKNGGILEDHFLSDVVKVRTTLNFFCNKTYRLEGPTWSECIYDEFEGVAWSNSVPRCEAITCPDHNPPGNGAKSLNGPFHVGVTVAYSCYTGYKLIGSHNRTCRENGMWSGVLASCDSGSTVCLDPGIPINGLRNGHRFDTGDVVQFSCKSGNYLFGNSTRVCQSNGYWTGTEVFCRGPNEFDDITAASATLITQIDRLKLISDKASSVKTKNFNSSATNSSSRTLDVNDPGGLNIIFILDSSGSVGKKGFATAKKFAIALVQHIGVSQNGVVRVGAITFSSDVTVNFYTRDYLTTGEIVEQLSNIQYKPGDTATNPALMAARTEVIPDATSARPSSSTAIFLITDGRANVRGRPKEEADLIVQEFDAEIYAIGVGSNVLEKELADITYPKGDENDRHYMKVESFSKMNEMLQFLINGTIDYSACGLLQRRIKPKEAEPGAAPEEGLKRRKRNNRMRIVGGEKVSKHWPWMAGLFYGDLQRGLQSFGGLVVTLVIAQFLQVRGIKEMASVIDEFHDLEAPVVHSNDYYRSLAKHKQRDEALPVCNTCDDPGRKSSERQEIRTVFYIKK
ncbi:Sushi, von Willebrand factor type A, EGF and pentraxin domain-containing protein 1 [Nymphon striatum]|nr:Sushi, von Willebrand factor type A, EGF and pentraxin domain-containing protein 1 [Nymphon striatum]